jgi:hypothetical protein
VVVAKEYRPRNAGLAAVLRIKSARSLELKNTREWFDETLPIILLIVPIRHQHFLDNVNTTG